jgi:transporter family protein
MTSGWLYWALMSAEFAAATALLAKLGLRGVNPDAAQLVRTAVAFAAIGALAASWGQWRGVGEFSRGTWALLVLPGVGTAASWACYFRALAVGDVGRVAAVDKLSVPLAAAVAAIALSERLSAQGWIGVALATAGVALVSLSR